MRCSTAMNKGSTFGRKCNLPLEVLIARRCAKNGYRGPPTTEKLCKYIADAFDRARSHGADANLLGSPEGVGR